jgi:hypothetical protein
VHIPSSSGTVDRFQDTFSIMLRSNPDPMNDHKKTYQEKKKEDAKASSTQA